MTGNLFLTENRRDVLSDSSDWTDDSVSVEKSRIRTKANLALDELTEIAQSTEIENRSVFDPEQIGTLLYWILNDPAMIEDGGLIGGGDDAPDEAKAAIPDSLQQYRHEVHSEAAQELLRVDQPGQGRR